MPANNKELVMTAFRDIFESEQFDIEVVARYFSSDYIQHVDGATIDYEQFIKHLKEQRIAVASFHVSFLSIASEDNIVFTNHLVTAIKKDGGKIKVKVMAQFTVKDGKIVACDELTHMLSGADEDRNLGSRH